MNGKNQNEALSEEMMRQIKSLRSYGGDAVGIMGMYVTKLGPGWAEGEMELKRHHLNPMGSVHGGFLFTLADSIGGTAAWTRGDLVATTNASFNYLNPAVNLKKIIARAEELKAGKNILTYEVSVMAEDGVLLAKGIFEYHSFHMPFTDCKKLYNIE